MAEIFGLVFTEENRRSRELRSFLEEAVVLSEAGVLDMPEVAAGSSDVQPNAAGDGFAPLYAMVEEAERRHIRSALERTIDPPRCAVPGGAAAFITLSSGAPTVLFRIEAQ